jgi:outer membrane protein
MRKFFLVTLIISFLALNSYAQELKFGFVDLNRALNECDRGKEAIRILENMVKEKQAIIDKKGEEIRRLEEELSKQSAVLNPESLKEKQEKLERLKKEYKRMVEDSNEELEKKRNEFMRAILTDLRNLIRQIGKEEGYTAIFEKAEGGPLLYAPEGLDITDELIKRFNEAVKAQEEKK